MSKHSCFTMGRGRGQARLLSRPGSDFLKEEGMKQSMSRGGVGKRAEDNSKSLRVEEDEAKEGKEGR